MNRWKYSRRSVREHDDEVAQWEKGAKLYPEPEMLPRWRHNKDRYGVPGSEWRFGYAAARAVFLFFLPAVIAICLIVGGIRTYAWHLAHESCPRQGAALGVETRWANYNYWSWACLTNVQGRWVPVGTVNNDTGLWFRGEEPPR